MKKLLKIAAGLGLIAIALPAQATFVSITDCSGANSCTITNTPPDPISPNPNDGVLLAWDEVQNHTLTEDLFVNRVFDPTASFVTAVSGGFLIEAGTVVSSHYLQWDPGSGSSSRVEATINLDSQIFAFITSDSGLFASDAALGLPGLDYADFGLRGLESGDTTVFNGSSVDISWAASSPGDWTRLITAFSPGGVADVPVPASLPLLAFGLIGGGYIFRRKQSNA